MGLCYFFFSRLFLVVVLSLVDGWLGVCWCCVFGAGLWLCLCFVFVVKCGWVVYRLCTVVPLLGTFRLCLGFVYCVWLFGCLCVVGFRS